MPLCKVSLDCALMKGPNMNDVQLDAFRWIPSSWLQSWADSASEPEKLTLEAITCQHGKLDPAKKLGEQACTGTCYKQEFGAFQQLPHVPQFGLECWTLAVHSALQTASLELRYVQGELQCIHWLA